MQHITFISTIHKSIGECNAEELHSIIAVIKPEVIFVEALEDTYSAYQKFLFSSFGVSHGQLEIAAIQQYGIHHSFEYVPVLDFGLPDAFDKRSAKVVHKKDWQYLIDNFNELTAAKGFKFLNSQQCITLQENMRTQERHIIDDAEAEEAFQAGINTYEDNMMRNIYVYCKNHDFSSAIFMCGAAHRQSIIEKIQRFKDREGIPPQWTVFEG